MMVFLSYILVQLYKVFRRIFKKRIDGLLFVQAMIRKTTVSIRRNSTVELTLKFKKYGI